MSTAPVLSTAHRLASQVCQRAEQTRSLHICSFVDYLSYHFTSKALTRVVCCCTSTFVRQAASTFVHPKEPSTDVGRGTASTPAVDFPGQQPTPRPNSSSRVTNKSLTRPKINRAPSEQHRAHGRRADRPRSTFASLLLLPSTITPASQTSAHSMLRAPSTVRAACCWTGALRGF